MSIFHLSSFPPARRTKVTRACDPCRKRKVRCTGRAVCPRCMERNLNCTFTIGDLRSSRGAKSKRLNPGADGKKIECIEVSRAISDSGGNVTVLPSIEDIFKQLNIELVSFMKNSGENGLPNMNDIMNALSRAHSKTDLEAIDKSPLSDLLITPPCSGGSYRGSNECFFSIDNNKLMYSGFANCESVVQETKFIFRNIIGITKFDSVEFDPINDIVIEPTIEFLETIPEKHICIQAFNTFVIYVHWQAYLFDEEDFRREIDELFQNSNQIKTRVLLYFILAISTLVHSHDAGNFICDQAVNYFKSAVKLNTTIKDQDDYWLIYFNFFQALFYIYTNKFKTAWLFVENAIKSGEKLNIHKLSIDHPNYDHLVNLFRTLYYYNKSTAITAGKPALFLNEDCHEFTPTNQQYEISRFAKTIKFDSTERINYITNPDNDQLFRSKVYFYRTQLLRIATKIDNSVYNNSEIKVSKFKTLAVELKEWYANLPPDLKVENSSSGNSEDEIKHRYACLHLNSVHLYAIFLLSRPLLMYERTCQFTPEIRNSIPCEFVGEFKNAAVTSCVSMIIAIICSDSKQNYRKLERNIYFKTALYACSVLGICLIEDLDVRYMEYLKIGLLFFKLHINKVLFAKNYAYILEEMIITLSLYHSSRDNDELIENLMSLRLDNLQDENYPDLNYIAWADTQNNFVTNEIASIREKDHLTK